MELTLMSPLAQAQNMLNVRELVKNIVSVRNLLV
jgi:hypothetical protein